VFPIKRLGTRVKRKSLERGISKVPPNRGSDGEVNESGKHAMEQGNRKGTLAWVGKSDRKRGEAGGLTTEV